MAPPHKIQFQSFIWSSHFHNCKCKAKTSSPQHCLKRHWLMPLMSEVAILQILKTKDGGQKNVLLRRANIKKECIKKYNCAHRCLHWPKHKEVISVTFQHSNLIKSTLWCNRFVKQSKAEIHQVLLSQIYILAEH